MTRSNTAIFTLAIMVFASAAIGQSADPVDELEACARMTDRDARFACFDDLGQRILGEESADEGPTQEEVVQPEAVIAQPPTDPEPLPDDLGVSGPRTTEYSGTVTSCKKGHYGDWYFVFDNGQVWKEVNRRNRRFKDCNFNVTITKDSFGYKMQIDGLGKTVRVKRHQ